MSLAAQNVNAFAAKSRAALKAPIDSFEAFEAEMSRVKGLTQTAVREFEVLKNRALELGSSIGEFSALDVAKGMSDFGIAGYKTDEILGDPLDAQPVTTLRSLVDSNRRSRMSSNTERARFLSDFCRFGLFVHTGNQRSSVLAACF